MIQHRLKGVPGCITNEATLLFTILVRIDAFRAYLGILRLSKQHSEEPLEAVFQRALALGACSYKSLEPILCQGLERLPPAQQNLPLLPNEHINLRDPGYYH